MDEKNLDIMILGIDKPVRDMLTEMIKTVNPHHKVTDTDDTLFVLSGYERELYFIGYYLNGGQKGSDIAKDLNELYPHACLVHFSSEPIEYLGKAKDFYDICLPKPFMYKELLDVLGLAETFKSYFEDEAEQGMDGE